MRVIKEGKMPPVEVEVKCGRCGCEFAYGKEDVKPNPHYEDDYWVECPSCGKAVAIGENPFYSFKD